MESNNYLLIKSAGSSMRPAIKDGDYLLVKRCLLDKTRAGDIVAVNSRNNLCIHRLVWRNHAGFVIKGDSISSFGYFTPGQNCDFIGKVVSITRNNKVIATGRQCSNTIRLLISLCLIPWQIARRH
ncbi:MAG: S24/S26 family peptidase [Planctomycetota bacterium]